MAASPACAKSVGIPRPPTQLRLISLSGPSSASCACSKSQFFGSNDVWPPLQASVINETKTQPIVTSCRHDALDHKVYASSIFVDAKKDILHRVPAAVERTRVDPKSVVSVILGGGAGTRLFPLTKRRAKPAVPIGGAYTLIDVPMSNCINSGINKIYILTQFNSASLNRHIARTYSSSNGIHFGDGFVEVEFLNLR